MSTRHSRPDRMRELTSVSAGHAASAFSQLTGGRTIKIRTPELVRDPKWPASVADEWSSGVLFEFEGCLEAVVAILFREPVRDGVAREMLGQSAELTRENIEAVIMELGNILVSRVASAIADTVGERLLPSIPVLAFEDAAEQLTALCAARGVDPSVRIECEFADREGELGGLLVLIPAASQDE